MTAAIRPSFREQDFRKAFASQPDKDCVRVARKGSYVELRDDKTEFGSPEDIRLVFTDAEFDEALAALRTTGAAHGTCLEITTEGTTTYFRRAGEPAALAFTATEVEKFMTGVKAREFDAAAFAA
ncbi:DUF397 domain-containing protein [Amycolatopsis kentuckyensis]|uniref:DUF397 domain-containing protein n=1 Tax=Amycolatopsis kentuckyensis TaxID=218823 RepID=UPI00356611AE